MILVSGLRSRHPWTSQALSGRLSLRMGLLLVRTLAKSVASRSVRPSLDAVDRWPESEVLCSGIFSTNPGCAESAFLHGFTSGRQ